MHKGSIKWAPWPEGGAHRVRVTSATSRQGNVSVIWQDGPLKGRPANLEAKSLRASRCDAAVDEWEELL